MKKTFNDEKGEFEEQDCQRLGTFQHFRAMRTVTQDQTTTSFIKEHFSSSSKNLIET